MRRKRLILTAVLLVAVAAVVVPNWQELWLRVAYEKRHGLGGLTYFKKRAAYLPGENLFCNCVDPLHHVCGRCRSRRGHPHYKYGTRCTCPYPTVPQGHD